MTDALTETDFRVGKEPIQKPHRSKQDYGTPLDFINAVIGRFGPLVCDLAASSQNAKAEEFYTEAQDSLKQEWATDYPNGNLWLNPPFADIAPWAENVQFMSERRRGLILMLTPASVGSNWFADFVNRRAMVFGLLPRLVFEGTKDPYPKDLMLSVFGMGMVGFDCWRWKSSTPNGGDPRG